MDEKHANSLLQAVARQRDAALNAVAYLEAQVEMLKNEVAELKAQEVTGEPKG